MQDPLKIILRILPLLSAASATFAVVYAAGFVLPFSPMWLGIFTIADLLSITWGVLPVVIMMGAAGLTMPRFRMLVRGNEVRDSVDTENATDQRDLSALGLQFMGWGAVVGLMSTVAMSLGGRFVVPPSTVALFLLIQSLVSLVLVPLLFSQRRPSPTIIAGYALCLIVFMLGVGRALAISYLAPTDLITLKDGRSLCGVIIHPAERGVLVHMPPASNVFIPSDQLSRYSSSPNCEDVVHMASDTSLPTGKKS